MQHRLSFIEHLVIPKSQHPKSFTLEIPAALLIAPATQVMLRSIYLDNQFLFQTHEVRDVIANRYLPAESMTKQLPSAQITPQEALGVSGVLTQCSGTLLCS